MLPVPFETKGLPSVYAGDTSTAKTALCNFMDTFIQGLLNDIKQMDIFLDPARCPGFLLEELGYFLGANLLNFNTETQKRKKISDAIQVQKIRSTWADDVKLRIDNYVGGDSQIVAPVGGDDWILVGTGIVPASYYWASMGADGLDDNLGLALIGTGLEVEVSGNIFIDVDSAALTADQVEQLKSELADAVPAYYKIHLGYYSGGLFVEYANGLIG